ncbi:type II toxin-antitoxin system RelE/ParE family toxin [Bacteroides sp. OttesenSCG-928-D19]|nr:type II toxin-antitoxin system RelE/ParE family toxin [Bacteroides sp. OttesenSCG-928-D19]
MEVVWTELAKISFLDILKHIESTLGTKTAFDIRLLIEESIENLISFPQLGRVKQTISNEVEIRYLVVKRSKIFYYISGSDIIIILIWDTRRNPETLKDILYSL